MKQPIHSTYDSLGRQVSAIVDGVSTNLYGYDVLTQELATETQNGGTITRTYDALGRSIGFDLDSAYNVAYGYDSYGRFASVGSDLMPTANYSYLANSDLLAGYTLGDFTRTVSYEPSRSLISSVVNSFGNNTLSRYDYTNDELGRRTSISRSGQAFGDLPVHDAYGYKDRSEVTSARRTPVGSQTELRVFSCDYVYDPIGSAPSEARRFLQGESPCRVRTSHPLVPSVGTMEEESNPNEIV